MIRYALKCDKGHDFDSWFASAEACDSLMASGRLACMHCGSAKVTKSLMAPSVSHGKGDPDPATPPRPLSAPQSPMELALARLRKEIEEKSEYVGMRFASEARAMHEGDAPERPIFGEAKLDEAKALIEDGIPVAPLPFLPPRKTN
ncbi:MAG: DUF1178 family protein [Paracoccaceae bacterium]|nr:DUF1178 family protein [Paracoccaceae bacterium]MDE3238362.1 DUF1178 family protein [Paracoccaceae bacterium]